MKEYEDVAAGTTAQTIGESAVSGAYLSHLIVFPASTSPGAVTLIDDGVSKVIFPGGADSVSNLVPFVIFFGIDSLGTLQLTTGANVSVRAVGDFG